MTSTLARGSKLGDYEVLRAIQSGGMGDVLLARRRGAVGFEKLFAIKTMRSDLRDLENVRIMFADEARLLSRLAHPAIAQVHDFGEQDGTLFLVMEYVAGIGFRELMELDPGPGIVCRALAEACRGLHAAHELRDLTGRSLGVVHRDVSPENLMLSFEGRVKVLDFGIALVRGRQAPVTEFGTIKGKPPYLAPEQVKGEAVDRRTDVFACAIVLYEMLTGVQLFAGATVYAIARAIEHRDIAPPSTVAGALPAGLDELVLRGLERNPAERFQTAQLLAEELERIAGIAGAESLDSYAMRELFGLREQHRDDLRAILSGEEEPSVRARPTGSVTALAETLSPAHAVARAASADNDDGDPTAALAAVVSESRESSVSSDAEDRDETTDIGNISATHGRRWRRDIVALGLVLVAVGGGLTIRYLSGAETRADDGQNVGQSVDSRAVADGDVATVTPAVAAKRPALDSDWKATDAPGAVPRPPTPVPTPEPGERRTTATADTAKERQRRGERTADTRASRQRAQGARTRTESTGPEPNRSDHKGGSSAPASGTGAATAPQGFGKVNIAATPYALVRIDGKQIGTTPIFGHSLPAGRHEVVLVSPKTDEVRLRRTFDLGAGDTERIIVK